MEDIQFHPIYCEKTILPGEKNLEGSNQRFEHRLSPSDSEYFNNHDCCCYLVSGLFLSALFNLSTTKHIV